jgi:hypothetical protein
LCIIKHTKAAMQDSGDGQDEAIDKNDVESKSENVRKIS